MKSDIWVRDPQKRPICPKVGKVSTVQPTPSRFKRKKQFDGDTVSPYNGNFKCMPKDN